MMMLRLARAGTKKRPVYHVVAADRRSRRDGRYVEQLGYFEPQRDVLVVNQERVDYWLAQGAQPSETVGKLIRQVKIHGNTELATKPAYEPPPVEAAPAKPAEAEAAPAKPAEAEAAPAEAEAKAEAPKADAPKAEEAEAKPAEAADAAPEAAAETPADADAPKAD
jgi:small subunit ribosomal protein S16